MERFLHGLRARWLAALLVPVSGCSFIGLRAGSERSSCPQKSSLPGADTAVAVVSGALALLALSTVIAQGTGASGCGEGECTALSLPIVGFTLLTVSYGASAAYGYGTLAKCRALLPPPPAAP